MKKPEIDEHLFYLIKDDLSSILNDEPNKELEQIIGQYAAVLPKELHLTIKINSEKKEVPLGSIKEAIREIRDLTSHEIAVLLCDMQEKLGENYVSFREHFVELLKELNMNGTDLQNYKSFLEEHQKLIRNKHLCDLVLEKAENETEEQFKKRKNGGNGYYRRTLNEKKVLPELIKKSEENLINAISYYINNHFGSIQLTKHIIDFYKKGENLDETLDLTELLYIPLTGNNFPRPIKQIYLNKALSLSKDNPIDIVSQWSYVVRDKISGGFSLEDAIPFAIKEVIQSKNKLASKTIDVDVIFETGE